MCNCGKMMFGIIVGITTVLTIKVIYEYGRYSAIRDLFKHGFVIVEDKEASESKDEK